MYLKILKKSAQIHKMRDSFRTWYFLLPSNNYHTATTATVLPHSFIPSSNFLFCVSYRHTGKNAKSIEIITEIIINMLNMFFILKLYVTWMGCGILVSLYAMGKPTILSLNNEQSGNVNYASSSIKKYLFIV